SSPGWRSGARPPRTCSSRRARSRCPAAVRASPSPKRRAAGRSTVSCPAERGAVTESPRYFFAAAAAGLSLALPAFSGLAPLDEAVSFLLALSEDVESDDLDSAAAAVSRWRLRVP